MKILLFFFALFFSPFVYSQQSSEIIENKINFIIQSLEQKRCFYEDSLLWQNFLDVLNSNYRNLDSRDSSKLSDSYYHLANLLFIWDSIEMDLVFLNYDSLAKDYFEERDIYKSFFYATCLDTLLMFYPQENSRDSLIQRVIFQKIDTIYNLISEREINSAQNLIKK